MLNIILSAVAPMAKILSAVLGCAEAHLVEQPDATLELAVEGDPQPGSFAPMVLDIHVELLGPQEFSQCVMDSL